MFARVFAYPLNIAGIEGYDPDDYLQQDLDTDDAKDLLVEEGYDPAMGARPLRRAIQRLLEDPLADELLHGTLTEGLVIVVDRDGDKMVMERREAPEAPAAPDVEAVVVGADSEGDSE